MKGDLSCTLMQSSGVSSIVEERGARIKTAGPRPRLQRGVEFKLETGFLSKSATFECHVGCHKQFDMWPKNAVMISPHPPHSRSTSAAPPLSPQNSKPKMSYGYVAEHVSHDVGCRYQRVRCEEAKEGEPAARQCGNSRCCLPD